VTKCYNAELTSSQLTISWSPWLQRKKVGENNEYDNKFNCNLHHHHFRHWRIITICSGDYSLYSIYMTSYLTLLWTYPHFNCPPYYSVLFMPVKWEYTVYGTIYTSYLNGLSFDLWSGVMAWLFIRALIVSEWRVLGMTGTWWSYGKGPNFIRTTHGLLFWREKQSLNQ
jgi:hypothetical protein